MGRISSSINKNVYINYLIVLKKYRNIENLNMTNMTKMFNFAFIKYICHVPDLLYRKKNNKTLTVLKIFFYYPLYLVKSYF